MDFGQNFEKKFNFFENFNKCRFGEILEKMSIFSNFSKISTNFDFGKNFEKKIRFFRKFRNNSILFKFSKAFDFGQKFSKISENFDFGQIFEKFRFNQISKKKIDFGKNISKNFDFFPKI